MQVFKWIFTSLSVLVPMTVIVATHRIDGFWLNERNQLTIEIVETSSGIQVKRGDQQRWHHYDRIRDDQYRDHQGNTYHQSREDRLEWESHHGHKKLRFRRLKRDLDTRSSYNHSNSYPHHYPYAYGKYRLSGKWINEATGNRIRVRQKGSILKVRSQRGRWNEYRRTRNGNFMDRYGNKYRVHRRSHEYISHRGDLIMRFHKY